MRPFIPFVLGVTVALLILAAAPTSEDRLYGRVTTHQGERYEGFIRWDKNEASWVDILDGSKVRDRLRDHGEERERRTFRIFGFEFDVEDESRRGWGGSGRSSGIRFGHIERLENAGRNRALLTLRSGQRLELRGGSSDIGSNNRGIVIDEQERGTVELRWRDIDRIEFRRVPHGARTSDASRRLFGTLTTQEGQTFTGYICWDVDEALAEDVLDGEDEDGRDHEIPFAEITTIAHHTARSARVLLRSGDERILHGTNDVNSSNRDILVLDPSLGQVRVSWEAFGEVVFEEPEYTHGYNRFYTSGPLTGTVETRDGDQFTGEIRWDNDEAFTWELINGEQDGLSFQIELGLIRRIERLSAQEAHVTLFDGRAFDLRGSNDVNDDNDGIYITRKDGDEQRIDWDDFDQVTFEKP